MHDDATARRFWSKVDKSGDCWVWTAGRFLNKKGVYTYGMFTIRTRAKYAHRIAWELVHGPIPRGLRVLHSCDNPPCVRPDHLRLGTDADNRRDAMERHRLRRREANHKTKLTEAKVVAIKRRWNEGEIARVLAADHGVTVAAIFRIVSGRNWPGIGEAARPHGRHGVPPTDRYATDH
jgi:hypothetical protein